MATADPNPAAGELDALLEGEIPGLRGYLARLVGDREETEDLVQETLARALRYRHAFDASGSLAGWLRRSALRIFLDQRRRAAERPRELGDREAELPARRERDPATAEELRLALAGLSSLERELLVRFHAGGESIAELSTALSMPVGSIKSHLHRARRRLAERDREAPS